MARLLPSGSEFQVTRIDVVGPAAQVPPAPAPAASAPSTGALILGALAIGAIGYIIGHSSAPQPVYEYDNGPWGPGGWHRTYQQCETRGRHQVCWIPNEGSQHR